MVPAMSEQRDKTWSGVAIITGASSGIGEAIARKLAPIAKGLVISARRIDRINTLASHLGEHVIPMQCDVRNQQEVEELANQAMHHFGRIDAIVNNAGIAPMASMLRCRVEDWDNMIDTNLKGVLYGIAAVLPHMLEQKTGTIINISSEAARKIFLGAGVYCATKHAIRALSEGLQQDLSARSRKDRNAIRVATIAPGVVMTDLAESVTYEPAKQDLIKGMESVSEPLTAENIAECVTFILNSPSHVEVGEIIVRPTKQNM
jgi:NADP-dependent 3-hydroxy acid dehydrogenase YdfG